MAWWVRETIWDSDDGAIVIYKHTDGEVVDTEVSITKYRIEIEGRLFLETQKDIEEFKTVFRKAQLHFTSLKKRDYVAIPEEDLENLT